MKKSLLFFIVILVITAVCVSLSSCDINKSTSTEKHPNLMSPGLGINKNGIVVSFGSEEHVIIPETYNGNPVVGIDVSLLYTDFTVKSIHIPSTVETISEGTFKNWFSTFANLESITVDEGNPYYMSIDGVLFTDGGKTLYYYPCAKPDESYTVPEGVEYISRRGLRYCNAAELTFPSTLKIIEDEGVLGCQATTLILPDSVTEIGKSAFKKCSKLTSIRLSTGLSSIGDEAFFGCKSLESIVLPSSVSNYGVNVFMDCEALENVTLPENMNAIPVGFFRGCHSLTSINIPDSVTEIRSNAFSSCRKLEKIDLPDTITHIHSYTFYDCQSLKAIDIPDSVTNIGSSAFADCARLDELRLPDSLTFVDDKAFSGCAALKSVYIPDNEIVFEYDAFEKCVSIEKVYVSSIDAWLNYQFETTYSNPITPNPLSTGCTLYINGEILTDVVITEGVEEIPANAFAKIKTIKSVKLPSTLNNIGENAFIGCLALESINIPEGVISIGAYAFKGCGELENIEFLSTLEEWDSVIKCGGWYPYDTEFTVICTDGKIVYKNGNELERTYN